ncbi:MAG TPA: signal recognition particle-docking protein FtsY [Pseudonocardiaceae bacterium]|nr:signal recognition particle-docking protein FtsY [Pseudonocardiaceae bacterium]
MSTTTVILIIVAVVVVLLVILAAGLLLARRRRISLTEQQPEQTGKAARSGGYQAGGGISLAPGGPRTDPPAHPAGERTEVDGQPTVGDDASVPRDAPRQGIVDVALPDATDTATTDTVDAPTSDTTDAPDTGTPASEAPTTGIPTQAAPAEPATTPVPVQAEPPTDSLSIQSVLDEQTATVPTDEIEPSAGRLNRLRGQLSRSRSAFGQSLLGLLGAGDLDEESWTDIEDTLLLADLGAATTTEIVDQLREALVAGAVRSPEQARALLRDVLVGALHPDMDRSVRALPHDDMPAVILIAGVNGTGKTTTTGKLARVLVADGRRVLLGAADTFRAAAADQLETWGNRVGAEVVRGKEGADPAAVAFDAVKRGGQVGVDTVVIDTAGRLHTKTGLMDELSKVKRVVEKQAKIDEVLLVLDATTGQNGLTQARVFAELIDVTGIVLTKLDGTAKGGIVFQVQRELGVPVKLVGLGEGADDLAPFEPTAFVDALLN